MGSCRKAGTFLLRMVSGFLEGVKSQRPPHAYNPRIRCIAATREMASM